jgi:hypothetical protein
MSDFFPRVCLAIVIAALAVVGRAQTITTTVTNGVNGTFTVSSTDLADNSQATFGSIALNSGSAGFSSSVSSLTDGVMYFSNNPTDTSGTFTPAPGTSPSIVTITFNISLNPAGYSLTSIDVYTGSGSTQFRSEQNYSVAWAAPGSGTYTPLLSVSNVGANGQFIEVWTHTFDSISGGSASFVTGVGSLQFTFSDTNSGNPESMYREIDVFGAATAIPEPARVGIIFSLVSLGLAIWRRR